ncbi:MAG: aminodeoxychorismate synthase component I [Gammaproteobacteria bacterium]|nr:aminodeoxychorismate synthase component I [Gammaproteobacteria bacterium]
MLALHERYPERYPVLLDSSAAGLPLGRFTLLLAAPEGRLLLDRDRRLQGEGEGDRFCDRLDTWWKRERGAAPPAPWPFAGGWFLFLGYELASEVEPSLRLPPSPLPVVALAWRMRAALLHDHESGATTVLAEPAAAGIADRLRSDLQGIGQAASHEPIDPVSTVSEDDPERYLQACRAALAHIAAGDVYQANLARAWRASIPGGMTPARLYARLRAANPGAFSGIAQLDDVAILSSSPERLVRVRGRRIDTRPIAGTRPRLASGDAASIAELTASAKERAEHVMLIDLERNDLGRLCEPGSVEVDEFMAVESFAHVHHIVSNVCGQLRDDVTPGAVIRALFPGGTITGCPKVRCMQLIGDLEGKGRGAYTGAMGYLALDGSLDLNILIRTMTVQGGEVELRAGAGIVADSDPLHELDETRAKARGVLRALGSNG